jgi:hypothetical protein
MQGTVFVQDDLVAISKRHKMPGCPIGGDTSRPMDGHNRLDMGVGQQRVRAKLPDFGGMNHDDALRSPTCKGIE